MLLAGSIILIGTKPQTILLNHPCLCYIIFINTILLAASILNISCSSLIFYHLRYINFGLQIETELSAYEILGIKTGYSNYLYFLKDVLSYHMVCFQFRMIDMFYVLYAQMKWPCIKYLSTFNLIMGITTVKNFIPKM